MKVGRDVVSYKTLSSAIQSKREFVFGVVVPLERNTLEFSVEKDPKKRHGGMRCVQGRGAWGTVKTNGMNVRMEAK